MKLGFIVKLFVVHTCMGGCAHEKGSMQRTVWIEPDRPESMLHMEGQAQYVEGVLRGELKYTQCDTYR